jgi:O-antigen/teichoic acid export membrane protein
MNENTNISHQIAKGTLWTVLMRLSIRLLGVISLLILARFLVPEDYGLIAKAVLTGSVLELITEFGFFAALIKNQRATPSDYNTVWTLSILRALFLGMILVLSASSIATFYNEPSIESLIYVYAFSNVLVGFTNVGIVDFHKEMKFNKDFTFNLLKKLSSFFTTIIIAIVWKSYWAFPIGVLVGNIIALVASFIMSSYRPVFSLAATHSIFNFSKWMFLYSFMRALSGKLDAFILSKLASDSELGLYTVSKELATMPTLELAMPVARASLPGLSLISHNSSEFNVIYSNTLLVVLLLALPAAVGVSVLSTEITYVLLGSLWADAAPFIEILALVGLTQVFGACSVSSLIAYDRVDLLGKVSIFTLLVNAVILPGGFFIAGVNGLVWGVLLANSIRMLTLILLQSKLGILSLLILFKGLWRATIATGVMYFVLIYLLPLINNESMLIKLSLLIIAGGGAFSIVLILLCSLFGFDNGPELKFLKLIKIKPKE